MWTQFWDMHSGGDLKEAPYSQIYIEASKEEAKLIFYNKFGHSADRISCTCCGKDYSITEYDTLEQAAAYQMGCKKDVLIVTAEEIKSEYKIGVVPETGWVWR